MGQGAENGASGSDTGAGTELQRTRFGAYFPRVFAFAHSLTADETTAKEAAVEAFGRAFAQRSDLSEEEFAVRLFAGARDHCRTIQNATGTSDELNTRERELLGLMFDARLNRELIRRLMQTTEQAVSETLLRALRKIRARVSPAAAGDSLRIA
jgi:hypothetical protein